jgi:hypothetical protein
MQKNISTSDCFQQVSLENKQTISELFAHIPAQELDHLITECYTEIHLYCFLRKCDSSSIRALASAVNRSGHPSGMAPFLIHCMSRGRLLLFTALSKHESMTNRAYAENNIEMTFCVVFCALMFKLS